jgi:LysM repeat protein
VALPAIETMKSRIRLEFVMSLRVHRSRSVLSRRASAAFIALSVGVVVPAARAQQSARPSSHAVKRGDTLWDISKSYLGDPFLWPEIYRINTDQIEDPHWIYPGELLKLPGAQEKVVAQNPPSTPQPAPARVSPPVQRAPAVAAAPAPADSVPAPLVQRPASAIRMGEYVASPWVDERGGPRGSGFLMGNRDLPGIASHDHAGMNLYDGVLIAPPAGSVSAQHELYLTYRLGPVLEDLGQVVIPTGVIQITRAAQNGEAAVGRVVKLFGEMAQGQRLVPYDSAAALVAARPAPVSNGRSGTVRWVYGSPVLASVQSYIVLDISRRDLTTGDQIDLYKPRQKPADEGQLATPELPIARAQVLRVTQYGATAIITSQQQPAIAEGTAARIAAKMP